MSIIQKIIERVETIEAPTPVGENTPAESQLEWVAVSLM